MIKVKKDFELDDVFKETYQERMLEILIYHKLEEFKKTRAIATAVEICNMYIKAMELDKE